MKEIQYNSSRWAISQAKRTIKNIFDALIELITNADDSYKRKFGDFDSFGEIIINIKRNSSGHCTVLEVTDSAEGLNKEDILKALEFGGAYSEADKHESVRGWFGQGLKETIIALGKGEIYSVKDGLGRRTQMYKNEDNKIVYDDELLDDEFKEIDKDSETTVRVEIDREVILTGYNHFKKNLEKLCTLRDIITSPKRRIVLNYDDNKTQTKKMGELEYNYPKSTIILDKKLPIKGYKNDFIKLVIKESDEALDFKRTSPTSIAGILIKSGGTIIENQLFRYETKEEAKYFFGEAECPGIEKLKKDDDDDSILKTDRKGLDWKHHEYAIAIQETIEEQLRPIINRKISELDRINQNKVNTNTQKKLNKLCSKLNKIAKDWLNEEIIVGGSDLRIRALMVKPESVNIIKGTKRTISVYSPEIYIKEYGDIILLETPDFVTCQNNKSKLTENSNGHWSSSFTLSGDAVGEVGIIKAYLGDKNAIAQIKIVEETKKSDKKSTLYPKKGGFVREIKPNLISNPERRSDYDEGTINIYINFPSTKSILEDSLELKNIEQNLLISELIGEAYFRKLAYAGTQNGKILVWGDNDVDAYVSGYQQLQSDYQKTIQDIFLN